jgi:iron complex outermembrane receptor protein
MSARHLRIGSTSFIALAVAAISSPVFAQDSTADDKASDAKEIVVTGSLIRGSSEEAPAPVDVIGAEELSKQGSPSAIDLLKNLPNSSGIIGDANQFDARAQGNEGVASVNLRGLGPQRTLVLLNGKRIVQSGGSGIPIVDVNLIPSGAIGRIEVLRMAQPRPMARTRLPGWSTSSPAPIRMASAPALTIAISRAQTAISAAL